MHMKGRHPTAARPRAELIIGLNAIVTTQQWYNLTIEHAIKKALKATGGRVDPATVATEFSSLVRSVGLEPLRDEN